MRAVVECLRFLAKVVATPIFFLSFGIMWFGFVLFIGNMLQIFSFLLSEPFSWKEHIRDCNKFFCEPFDQMWHKKLDN